MTTVADAGARIVEYGLRPRQHEIFTDGARFRVVVAGRRSGKTHLDCVELVTAAADTTGSRCWYVAPTYRMAREIAWATLKNLVPSGIIDGSPNETYLRIDLINGSEIALKGADHPDRLRGPGLDLLILDEFAWIDKKAWQEVLRPALADRGGRALFTTTPCGFNWAYDTYMRGVTGEEGWRSWQFTTADAGIVPKEEIGAARRELDPRIFRQEYEASFETLQGRVYSNFDRDATVDDAVVDTGGDILIGQDFNVNPMASVIAVRAGDECHVLDSLELPISNTEEIAREMRQRFPDRSVIFCPDPSGKARKTSAPVGQTDFTILERAGFEVRAPEAAPPVVDRINNAQAMLKNAEGRRRLKIHPRAQKLIRALDGLTYKEGTSQPDKSLGLDHITDALGYLLWEEFNVLVDKPRTFTGRLGVM